MKILLLLISVGCASSQPIARHYMGTVTGSSDQIIAGAHRQPGEVEATFEENGSSATLYVHLLDRTRLDTLKFFRDDGPGWHQGWHWVESRNEPATIQQIGDSLYVSLGWGYGGESFYLKEVP